MAFNHKIANKTHQNSNKNTPVIALKELVANLQREQNKIQNLLSSLTFALRSFNNLNQFLELTPLMSSRVADAEGGALILYRSRNRVSVEHIYCQNNQIGSQIKKVFQQAISSLNYELNKKNYPPLSTEESEPIPVIIEQKLTAELPKNIRFFSTPIILKNEEKGRLYIFSSDGEYLWTQTRRKLVQLVADQTAVAIANNELSLELSSKQKQDRELEIAAEIQLRLLPRKCPKIGGLEVAAKCKTANRVGGDYYDFIPANYDRWNKEIAETDSASSEPWSIVIGDVMGKGVPAGLIMTMTRGMLRAEVLNGHSPAKILEHLNRVMYSDLDNSHRFVTLFYSEYNPKTRILRYTNAAHNPPLMWQSVTNTLKTLDTEGMLVGLDPYSEYQDAEVKLQLNDTILYYTDGLTDAVNQNGERFDEDNLRQVFQHACQNYTSVEEILDHIFTKVEKFIGFGHYNTDDMTLVVVRATSND